jgi:putative transposase
MIIFSLLFVRRSFRTRVALRAEILALRHQLLVLQRSNRGHRLRLCIADRFVWVCLSRLWSGWQSALVIVKPETVIAWHRQGFRLYWRWKSRHAKGRPSVSREVTDLIRKMSLANPRWGAPRIHGELLKLGFELSHATVAKYMLRRRKPPSQTWHTFLRNPSKDIVGADFFVLPTAFFEVLFVFVILSHDRRRPFHFAITEHPTAEWTARQLLEAFPWNSAPRYLLHDRDGGYGEKFCEAANCLGIREVLTAPQSPWQNAYVERLIGSIRRECLDYVIVFNQAGLRRILQSYFDYYERSRTHLSLGKDAPISRPIQPAAMGRGSWRFQKLAGSIIATNVSPPEQAPLLAHSRLDNGVRLRCLCR